MIRKATLDDLPSLRRLAAAADDAPYPLAPVIEEKCFAAGIAGDPETLVDEENGELTGLVTTCGTFVRLLFVHPQKRNRGVGSILLERALAVTGDREVTIAAEPANYFVPGIPQHSSASIDFFLKRGFNAIGGAIDLEVDLTRTELGEPSAVNVIHRAAPADRDDLLRFVGSHFGAAWSFEVSRGLAFAPATILIARRRERILGFAAFDTNNRGLGTFGPAGVSADARGLGVGGILLTSALWHLRDLGYDRAIIPWAAAVNFYAKVCGAKIAQRYVRLLKPAPTMSS